MKSSTISSPIQLPRLQSPKITQQLVQAGSPCILVQRCEAGGHGRAELYGRRRLATRRIHWREPHRKSLLIICRYAGIPARSKHFESLACVAKNVIRFCYLRGPFYRRSERYFLWARRRSFSAMQQDYRIRRQPGISFAPESRRSSTASSLPARISQPLSVSVVRSDSGTSSHHLVRRYGSDS